MLNSHDIMTSGREPLLSATASSSPSPSPISRNRITCIQHHNSNNNRDLFKKITKLVLLLIIVVVFTIYWTFVANQDPSYRVTLPTTSGNSYNSNEYSPARPPSSSLFKKHSIHVPTGQPGFPSLWDFIVDETNDYDDNPTATTATAAAANAKDEKPKTDTMNVTYDGRSIIINNERVLFLSGSMHPIRATKQTWEAALDLAVQHGLNMITMIVFWAEHQPLSSASQPTMDWTLPAGRGHDCLDHNNNNITVPSYCGWSLADAILAAASRGLFVHIRIGPYICAEYNYGGIPEWLPQSRPNMIMRRYDSEWMQVMEEYVTNTLQYLQSNHLFAHQGGPIVLAQIENELAGEDDESNNNNNNNNNNKKHSIQDYADWCGALVKRLEPNVIWTMCNGLNAQNTIVTCNGNCNTWMQQHGSSGRIQIDQPALWSEDELGFQVWGDDPKNTSDYFWGRTAQAMAVEAMKWFARGGVHLDYYMWYGGYNRGRAAAAGIMNAYATDAPVCPSGQPRQPKFDHFGALHKSIRKAAPILLGAPTALNHAMEIEHFNETTGEWVIGGGKQRMFVYSSSRDDGDRHHSAIFVENDSKKETLVKFLVETQNSTSKNSKRDGQRSVVLKMNPLSSVLLVDGSIIFDSSVIDPIAGSYKRVTTSAASPNNLFGWFWWNEPIGASQFYDNSRIPRTAPKPIEQTALNLAANISSTSTYFDYAWYETKIQLDRSFDGDAVIAVESQKASALILYLDGKFQGEAINRYHQEGNYTFEFRVKKRYMKAGEHGLVILSESLGYYNLIGRWIDNKGPKIKGITGDVVLASSSLTKNQSLVDGRDWQSFPGLHVTIPTGKEGGIAKAIVDHPHYSPHPTWFLAKFVTPEYDPRTTALYLNITRGRGHVFLNGHDLGRFWNITRGEESSTSIVYSQQFYFLPHDFLVNNSNGRWFNEVVFFDAVGDDNGGDLQTTTNLVLSRLEPTDFIHFRDEVDFPLACI